MATPITLITRTMAGLSFDAVFEETHESDLDVTETPVETGVSVSDHAFMKPLRLTISAGVSNISFRDFAAAGGTGVNFFGPSGREDKFASDSGRAREAFKRLTDLQRSAQPFTVVTGLKTYENMVCVTIRTSQDKDTAQALFFTADLREVIIVSTQVVTFPPRKAGATHRQAGPKKNKGEQQPAEVVKKKSLVKKSPEAVDALKGMVDGFIKMVTGAFK